MNNKRAKSIRKKAKLLFIEWIGSFLREDDRAKINIRNFTELLPDETHVYANRRIMHSAFSYKWFIKYIKRLNKYKSVEDITLKDVMENARIS